MLPTQKTFRAGQLPMPKLRQAPSMRRRGKDHVPCHRNLGCPTDDIPHHLRNPAMIFPLANANNGFAWFQSGAGFPPSSMKGTKEPISLTFGRSLSQRLNLLCNPTGLPFASGGLVNRTPENPDSEGTGSQWPRMCTRGTYGHLAAIKEATRLPSCLLRGEKPPSGCFQRARAPGRLRAGRARRPHLFGCQAQACASGVRFFCDAQVGVLQKSLLCHVILGVASVFLHIEMELQ